MDNALKVRLERIQRIALLIGILGGGLTICGAFVDPKQCCFSYLFACLFWLGLSLGCFLVTMIHHLAGGRWGYPTRRFLEAGFMVLPVMLILFLPLLLGLRWL